MHLSHYDPAWIKRMDYCKPYDPQMARAVMRKAAEEGMNVLIVDVEDVVKFKSHPQLHRPYSVPLNTYRTLVKEAQAMGLTVVPKLNFARGDDMHNAWMHPFDELADINKYCSHAIQLILELTEGLNIRYFHIGMDEDDRDAETFAVTIKAIHDELARRHIRTLIWADVERRFARHQKFMTAYPVLPRDIILMPWGYAAKSSAAWIRKFTEEGFEVWGCCGENKKNVAMWLKDLNENGGKGLVATCWRPLIRKNKPHLIKTIETTLRVVRESEANG